MEQLHDLQLDTPFTFANGHTVKNRIFKAAMSEQLGDSRHDPTVELEHLYRAWAEGGVGLSLSGNIMVDRNAIGERRNVVLDAHSDLDKFRRWTAAARATGCRFWAQLNHPGKQAPKLLCKQPVAPSAIGLAGMLQRRYAVPRALQEHEIMAIVEQFAASARLAREVGFDGVQIHGAHGYLVSQFLSPRHNQRTDRWGGSLENRMRFVQEVYRAIRAAVGLGFPVAIKLNSADFMRGGFSEEESMEVVRQLGMAGIDQIEVSGGTYESPAMVGGLKASTREREAYFLGYAERVRQLVPTPLVVTGGFRSTAGMLAALRGGATDFIGIARPLAIDPAMAQRLFRDQDYRVELPVLSTGVDIFDSVAVLNVSWYEHQMQRIGRQQGPKTRLSPWTSLGKVLVDQCLCAIRKRAA